jgi:hypothetical protein
MIDFGAVALMFVVCACVCVLAAAVDWLRSR